MRVCVITHSPSPYQVELFDAVAGMGELDLEVIYLYVRDPERLWQKRALRHEHVIYEAGLMEELAARATTADLLVMHYFKHPLSAQVMATLEQKGKRWVFWGERPRRHAVEWLSRIARMWTLRRLHLNRAPIWGMGTMAVDAYRREFGPERSYVNLPYFSDLKRFQVEKRQTPGEERVVLFSGSLIGRKGVDLVGAAFKKLVRQGVAVRLRMMGAGELERRLRDALSSCGERVEFVGFKDWQELPEAYARADVLCVPSRYDGWGLVVPEGLAAGLPVISTRQTGAAVEFIETGRNGWLIEPGNELALFEAMREAATMPAARLAEMSCAAAASVRGHQLEDGARAFIRAARDAMADPVAR